MDARPPLPTTTTAHAPRIARAAAAPYVLDYGVGPAPLRQQAWRFVRQAIPSRRLLRRALPLLIVLAAVMGWGGVAARDQYRLISVQKLCATYTLPPGEVVYEAKIEPVKEPTAKEPWAELAEVTHTKKPAPEPWQELTKISGEPPLLDGGPVLFLHERRSACGERRVVCVEYTGAWSPLVVRTVHCGSLVTRASFDPLQWSPNPNLTGRRLRFFAGQPDPADPARFTIAYDMDGRAGTVEGRLLDGGDVALRFLDGPAAASQAGKARLL